MAYKKISSIKLTKMFKNHFITVILDGLDSTRNHLVLKAKGLKEYSLIQLYFT